MPVAFRNRYQRCFISAPFGSALGVLPELLVQRGIAWDWAKDTPIEDQDARTGIAAADFSIVVLNGTAADYRGVYDAGVTVGLGKPVLLIQSKARPLPLDFRRFTTVKTSLANSDALAFHLDLFLATPPAASHIAAAEEVMREQLPQHSRPREAVTTFASELEHRAYTAILAAGGSAIAQPQTHANNKYRPDFLAWLGHLDAELLDPAVIEVKGRVEAKDLRRVEEKLLAFMQGTRVRTALVLSATPVVSRDQQVSPNVLWLTIDEFEVLAQTGRLGAFVRDTRNRSLHGAP